MGSDLQNHPGRAANLLLFLSPERASSVVGHLKQVPPCLASTRLLLPSRGGASELHGALGIILPEGLSTIS